MFVGPRYVLGQKDLNVKVTNNLYMSQAICQHISLQTTDGLVLRNCIYALGYIIGLMNSKIALRKLTINIDRTDT